MNLLARLQADVQPEVDLRRTYDAIVIGSGAAGGMAAHVLTSHGMKVLMLEAGKKLDINKELKSMEWPYEHPRRGDMPPGHHALSLNEYTIRQPPYAADSKYHEGLLLRPGLERHRLLQEHRRRREGSSVHRHQLRLGAGAAASAARRTSGAGWRCGSPTTTSRRRATTATARTGRSPTRTSSPTTTASISTSGSPASRRTCRICPTAFSSGRPGWRARKSRCASRSKKMNRVLTPYRAGVTTDGLKHNKYRSRCFGRGACNRRVGGCDIHAAFDSPTGLIYPAMDTGNLTLRTNSIAREILVDNEDRQGAAASRSSIPRPGRTYEALAKVVVRRRLDAGIGAADAAVEVGRAPERHRQLEQSRRPQLLRARHGPGRHRARQGARRQAARRSTMAGRAGSMCRDSGTSRNGIRTSFAPTDSKAAPAARCSRTTRTTRPGFGAGYKKAVRDFAGAYISMGGFGEVLARYENQVDLDPAREGQVGHSGRALQLQVRRQREEDVRGHGQHGAGDVRDGRASRSSTSTGRSSPRAGRSTSSGTARMGTDPKTSVLNQFQQSHDVKNLFVVDGSSHVSASCQNPTWTIMALAWRSCDYLADEFGKGNL